VNIHWREQASALHSTVASSVKSRNYHLAVERAPRGGWAWTSWHCDQPDGLVRHGTARTSALAAVAAERVVREWDRELARVAQPAMADAA
jgi:hypothetical protein